MNYQRSINLKKKEKLAESFHFLEETNEELDNLDQDFEDNNEDSNLNSRVALGSHVIFVDNEEAGRCKVY